MGDTVVIVQIRSQAAHIGKDRVGRGEVRKGPREGYHLDALIERAVVNVAICSRIDADWVLDVSHQAVVDGNPKTGAAGTAFVARESDSSNAIHQLRVEDGVGNGAASFDADSLLCVVEAHVGQRRADVVNPQRRVRIIFSLWVSGVISPGLRSHNFSNRIIICRGEYRRTVARRFADRTGVKLK